ncbi:MAG: DNA polymerase IV [Planctomycetes bacterium]|nr:DNA polymerase IV [Planctomycetota bacterium]
MVESKPGGPRRKLRARTRILHLDIDAFLASVVQLTEPATFGQPLAVGTGVVASRSYEAKVRGVETAMPLSEARRHCPELIVHEGDAGLAMRFRKRVGEIVGRFAARVELTSLDDMYAELQGHATDPIDLASRIRAQVRAETGLSVAQGIGATKTLARLATTKAKPGGIHWVRPGAERRFLDPMPVEMLPGVGHKTAETLATYRIRTVAELRLVDRTLLAETFGVRGEELYLKARGLPCGAGDFVRELDVEHGRPGGSWGETSDTREISRTTSLWEATSDPESLRAMLTYLVDRAAKALRERGRIAARLDVVLGLASGGPSAFEARERPRRSPTSLHRGIALAPPSSTTRILVERAIALLESLLDEHRCLVRLVGVRLGRLRMAVHGQQERFLFAENEPGLDLRGQRIDEALDDLRARHGFAAILAGEANALRGSLALGRDGFRLRTPSLTL